MATMVLKRKNTNTGVDTIHREVIRELDKIRPGTVLQIKKVKYKNGTWFKHLVVKNTGRKIMLITALIKSSSL